MDLSTINETVSSVSQKGAHSAAQGTGRRVIDVRVCWGENALLAKQVEQGEQFVIGEVTDDGPELDFVLGESTLIVSRLVLVEVNGAARVQIPVGATGSMQLRGQAPSALRDIAAECSPSPLPGVESSLSIPDDARLELSIGALTFTLTSTRPERRVPRSFGGSDHRSTLAYFALSFLAAMGVLGTMAFFVPPLGLTSAEAAESERMYLLQQYVDAMAEKEKPPEESKQPGEAQRSGGQAGEAAPDSAGKMGKPKSTASNKRYQIKGPKDNPEVRLAMVAEAAEFGLVGMLRGGIVDPNAPNAEFARDQALGVDPLSAQGNIFAEDLGEAAGTGGLSLLGLGEGGGHRYGVVGLGNIGTVGTLGRCQGAGCQGLSGFGKHHGRPQGSYRPKDVKVRTPGTVGVSGRMPPHVIQRIVRQNFGRFRLCYERGLMGNPNLEGRVKVGFVINRDGSVGTAHSRGSSLPNAEVTGCVVRAFYGLSFPKPENGTVNVTYPLMFTPG